MAHRPKCITLVFLVLAATALVSPPLRAEDSQRLADPSRDVPEEWLTFTEQTDFQQTPRYDETVRYCRRLAEASPWVEYQTFGTSPQGRPLPLLVVSKDGLFTPHAARESGKLVVFAQNCIHAGECAGKDASLMLVRDMAITKTRAELLDHVVFLVNPIFNVDGHERFGPYNRINQNGPDAMGWRVTSRNLNLNRDYTKADTVEMQAWLNLFNRWRPHLHFDNHSTDGGDWQYDLTYSAEMHEAAPPAISGWLSDRWWPTVTSALEADGHTPMTYFFRVDPKDPRKGIISGGFGPRYSTGYVSLRNRPSILVESHALKPYRTRVIGHYNLMLHSLELLNREPKPLLNAIREAERRTVAMGSTYKKDARLPIAIERTDEGEPFHFKGYAYQVEQSSVSGTTRIIYDNTKTGEFDTVWYHTTKVAREINPPLAYIVPAQWTEVIDRLRWHGLRFETLAQPRTLRVQSYRFDELSFPEGPYEGRFGPRYTTRAVTEERTFPPGSVIVPVGQPDGRVAIHLLEPDASDSLVAWGFFNAMFERKEYAEAYVLEDVARKMLASDPDLKKEFAKKLAEDPSFAADSRARLYFFYEQSPYWDDHLNRYPVGRLIAPWNQEK